MSDHTWDQARDHAWANRGFSATGIAEVLEAYSSHGGQLLGARRWAENPLTLTHVRWMGPQGGGRDAVRRPDDDAGLADDERAIWVELALDFPAMHPSAAGHDAPWLALNISPQQAAGLAVRLARALASAQRSATYGYASPPAPSAYGAPGTYQSGGPLPDITSGITPGMTPFPPGRSGGAISPPPMSAPPVSWPSGRSVSGSGHAQHTGAPGNFARGPVFDDGVSVIPSVEIELPVAGVGGVSANATRDFARDAAATFVRAMRGLPQARETRGWMRGGRMVLAARFIVAPGSGVATPQECNDAIQLLARTLAQCTLPFARVGIADPGEWSQGQTLAE